MLNIIMIVTNFEAPVNQCSVAQATITRCNVKMSLQVRDIKYTVLSTKHWKVRLEYVVIIVVVVTNLLKPGFH